MDLLIKENMNNNGKHKTIKDITYTFFNVTIYTET